MSDALTKVLLRRERLLARVGQQRASVELAVTGLAAPVALIDRVMNAGRILRAHPAAVTVLVAVLVALRGRTIFGVAARGFRMWRILRQLRALASRLGL